jgi:hypothetical protein
MKNLFKRYQIDDERLISIIEFVEDYYVDDRDGLLIIECLVDSKDPTIS